MKNTIATIGYYTAQVPLQKDKPHQPTIGNQTNDISHQKEDIYTIKLLMPGSTCTSKHHLCCNQMFKTLITERTE